MKCGILIVILVNFFVSANGFFDFISPILSAVELISDIVIASNQQNQAEELANSVYNKIEYQNIETRQQFQRAFDGIEMLGDKLNTFQEDTAHNFMQISRHITSLGNNIDKNHQEVLKIFGIVNDQFRRIGDGLSLLDSKIQRTFDVIAAQREIDPYLSSIINEMNGKIRKFKEYTDKIDVSYQYYMLYSKDIMAYSNQTLLDFVANIISHSVSSPMSLSQNINTMLTSPDGFLRHISESGVGDYLVCTKHESPQQFVHGFYMTALFAELKTLLVSTFARNLNVYFDQGLLSKERMIDMERSVQHIQKMTATVRLVLSNLDRTIRTCDSASEESHKAYHYRFTDFVSYPSSSTHRYISLKSMESDVTNGRVVTDIKFKVEYDTIHLQIQEAQMGPLASVKASTDFWVPVDRGSLGQSRTINKHSRFDIDVFRGLPGHVVTGVRFRNISDGVTLEVRVTPFNSRTGALDNPKSRWLNNMNPTNMRDNIHVSYLNSPLAAKVTPVVRSSTNQYLYFNQTGYLEPTKSIVPFFDIRPVLPSNLAPLSGLGLLYKSASDSYGGYLAPTVVCLDYSQFIQGDIQLPKRHVFKLFQPRRFRNSVAISNAPKTHYAPVVIVFLIIYNYVV